MPEKIFADQQEVFERLEESAAEVRYRGIRRDSKWAEHWGCFSVALEHPAETAAAIENISRRIAEIVPAVVYCAKHVHTTLCLCDYRPGFFFNPEDRVQQGILRGLIQGVGNALKEVGRVSCVVEFCRCFCLSTKIDLVGRPDEQFVCLVEAVRRGCENEGITMDPVWPHITMSRFVEDALDCPKFEFLENISRLGFGQVPTVSVAVGYSDWPSGNGHFTVVERFP